VGATDGIGVPPSGPFAGTLSPDTWYRLGISVNNSEIDIYLNGNQVGSLPGYATDGRFGLPPSFQTLLFGNTVATNSAPGYLNSIQLWDSALNAGQMLALGGPSATGIPTNIPPVPAFIQSRSPRPNENDIGPFPNINVVLNQGSATVTPSTITLSYDGLLVPVVVSNSAPTFTVTSSITNLQDPASVHTLTLSWSDTSGSQSATWQFTVANYQNITLPAPIYFENFDTVAEGSVPAGWTVTNWTDTETAGLNINDPQSDSYKDWVVVSTMTYSNAYPDTDNYTSPGLPPVSGNRRQMIPPIVLNGQLLSGLAEGNLMTAESDQRGDSQVQVVFTSDYDLTGKSNVFLAFHNINEQNQDNICSVEYSIDQGATWLPLLYMLDDGTTDGDGSDVVTNATTHQIDVFATFGTVRTDQAHGLAFSNYIGAAVSTNLMPYIRGCRNDDPVQQKRIEVLRLAAADGQPKVRFRLGQAGTGSWFFTVDDFGLYEINTPNITSQPVPQTVSVGDTATFTVTAQSASPLTYKWQHNGTTLTDNGHFSGTTNATLTITSCTTNDSGSYICVVGNSSGNVKTAPATLTVIAVPQITTQPQPVVTSAGVSVTLTGAALGTPPLTYTWLKNGAPSGQTGTSLTFASIAEADAGNYQLAVSNSLGGAVSAIARVIVAPAAFSNSMVVHLAFDGNYSDTSGHGNNATAVGSPGFAAGKFGQAFQFTTAQDGSSFNYATLGYPADLKFGANVDFSISFWANYTLQVDDPPFISNKDWGSSGNPGWGVFTQGNGHYRVNVTGTGGTKYDLGSSATPTVRDGTWHNIVLSYARGSLVSVYTDGVLSSTRTDTTTGSVDTDTLSENVNIGQDGKGTYNDGGSAGITNALIDDVGIWRRALSPQEAAAIYTSGQAGKDLSQVVVSTAPSKVKITANVS
ncbi:MAG TPA: immunoglobulin domain-containing protein, partial [Verrucomicrobiae bacterium]|nr:immunoglobulin domain-containing protein [Verrucomicrobiae bacterium]